MLLHSVIYKFHYQTQYIYGSSSIDKFGVAIKILKCD